MSNKNVAVEDRMPSAPAGLAQSIAMIEVEVPYLDIDTVENNLSAIIGTARDVASAAEELLRSLSMPGFETQSIGERHLTSTVAVAPRLILATHQQLTALKAMLQIH